MSPEGIGSGSVSDMETAPEFLRVEVPNVFPHFGDREIEAIPLDVPADLDLDEATRRWEHTGGQVRTFGSGPDGVRQKTYSLPDWLVKTQGARRINRTTEL